MKHTRVAVDELPDHTPHGVMLYCPRCGSEYSAHKGDYFLVAARTAMGCSNGHPRTNLQLVTARTVHESWSESDAECAARLLREGRY